MHYLAPGKPNLVAHLRLMHKDLLHTPAELQKWSEDDLISAHNDCHAHNTYPHDEPAAKPRGQ